MSWYDQNKRILPWRDLCDPYATWVSEVMLQQTRVETVLRYYPRFMQRFPTLKSLAEAPLDDVLKMWEGLGYYRRARNLQKGAKQVVSDCDSIIPKEPDELLKLTGVGEYTAGAIASIAYGVCTPAVDGNVIRVICRCCGIRENAMIPSVKRQITSLVKDRIPADRPGDFNQALMDLGASVCVPGTPDCERCPLSTLCSAYEEGDAEELPMLPDKKAPKDFCYDVCLIRNGDAVLMRQRTETMLQGLWIFPMLDGWNDQLQIASHIEKEFCCKVSEVQPVGEARHVFTHQIWHMKLYTMEADKLEATAKCQLITQQRMHEITLPTAMRAAAKAAILYLGNNDQNSSV